MNYQEMWFDIFDSGKLYIHAEQQDFSEFTWHENPNAEGVYLKHMVTAAQTNGQFSYHLVRIAAEKKIPKHGHATQLETHEVIAGSGICYGEDGQRSYTPGTVSILPSGYVHEVVAGKAGLYLLAKFIPALC